MIKNIKKIFFNTIKIIIIIIKIKTKYLIKIKFIIKLNIKQKVI